MNNNTSKTKIIILILLIGFLFYLSLMPIILAGIYHVSQIESTGWIEFARNFIPLVYVYVDLIKSSILGNKNATSLNSPKPSNRKEVLTAIKKFGVLLVLQTVLLFGSKGEMIESIASRLFFSFLYLFIKFFGIAYSQLLVELEKNKEKIR